MMTTTTTDFGTKAATPSDRRKDRNGRGRKIDPAFIWITVPAAADYEIGRASCRERV